MAVINIDDAYILDNTGKQVDDAVDYALYNSNRNLLDNPWFTVNQRQTSGTVTTNNTYVADRWVKGGSGGSVIIGSSDTLTPSGNGGFRQFNSLGKIISGEIYTLSILVSGGTVYKKTGTFNTAKSGWQISGQMTSKSGQLWAGVQNNGGLLDVLVTGNGTLAVNAVKLELGSVSTLANDAPPDYGEELLKCLRYQWVVDTENVYGVVGDATVTKQNTEAMMVVHYPVPMYKVPTLSVSGAFRTVGGNGSAIVVGSVTSMTVTSNASNKNFARVTINGTTMGGTGTSVVVGANGAGAKLIFDANI